MYEEKKQTGQILSVSELTAAIKSQLETSFPSILVQGEMTNCKIQSSGHFYFSLKDLDAQISAVMFKNDFSLIKSPPKGGEQVVVKAGLNVYPPKGNYQLIVKELSYVGLGELLQKLELLKIKLHKEGWFKKERKKALPFLPKRIGIVTSPTGAVIQDILHILSRRFPNFHVLLNPVKVQGEGASEEIARAIETFNRYDLVDVMIVCRGGGSLEDLWSFNDEKVAKALFESKIPTISAVGHETDHCIADYVADLRAPTPSAAAELVLPSKEELLHRLSFVRKRIDHHIVQTIKNDKEHIKRLAKHPFLESPYAFIRLLEQKIDDKQEESKALILHFFERKRNALALKKQQLLSFQPTQQIKRLRIRLEAIQEKMDHFLQARIQEKKLGLLRISHLIEAMNPRALLKRGYSILFSENKNSVINSVNMIKEEERATLLLSDGTLSVTVNKRV